MTKFYWPRMNLQVAITSNMASLMKRPHSRINHHENSGLFHSSPLLLVSSLFKWTWTQTRTRNRLDTDSKNRIMGRLIKFDSSCGPKTISSPPQIDFHPIVPLRLSAFLGGRNEGDEDCEGLLHHFVLCRLLSHSARLKMFTYHHHVWRRRPLERASQRTMNLYSSAHATNERSLLAKSNN